MTIYQKLAVMQQELKVPKTGYNTFGKYKYRSAEDILEAVKPLLLEQGCTLFNNEIAEAMNGEIVITSTVTLLDCESGEKVTVTGTAIVDTTKAGMAKPQATGSASSYAKKYAMGNLFLIDDTKDPDATNDHNKKAVAQKGKKALVEGSEMYDKAVASLKAGKRTVAQIEAAFTLTPTLKTKLMTFTPKKK